MSRRKLPKVEIRCCDNMPEHPNRGTQPAHRLVHLNETHRNELPVAALLFLDELFEKILPELADRVSSDLELMRHVS